MMPAGRCRRIRDFSPGRRSPVFCMHVPFCEPQPPAGCPDEQACGRFWYSLQPTDYGLQATNYGSQPTDHSLRITDHSLRITDYGLRITDYAPSSIVRQHIAHREPGGIPGRQTAGNHCQHDHAAQPDQHTIYREGVEQWRAGKQGAYLGA